MASTTTITTIMRFKNMLNHQLFSTRAYQKKSNIIKFVNTNIYTSEIPEPGLWMNEKICCPDDIIYYFRREFYKYNNVCFHECLAMGLADKLKISIMQSSNFQGPKYFVVKYNAFQRQFDKPNLIVFENINTRANENLRVECEIFNSNILMD